MITVGASYIKSKQVPAKEVLKDLIEMVRGVQEPQRGLFLRYYLSQMTKNVLPDVGSPYEGEGGSVTDAMEFVLENFRQMNRLWVRMQRMSPMRKKRREKERRELRTLVGSTIERLSTLDGLDLETYKTVSAISIAANTLPY